MFAIGPLQRKKVYVDLTKDMGETLPLPTNLDCFLGDGTYEQMNAPCPPAPLAMRFLRHCDSPMGVKNKPTAASQAGMMCSASLDLMG